MNALPPYDSAFPVRVADICRAEYPSGAYYRGVVGELCMFSFYEGSDYFVDLWRLPRELVGRAQRVARLTGPEAAALSTMLVAP